MKKRDRLIDTGPSKLAYRTSGKGPDVVLVHGWPLHGDTFRNIEPHLAESFTCHVFDLPGAGASEWNEATPMTLDAHARALCRAIDALALDRVAFAAHDSGGLVARIAAATLGARCAGLFFGGSEIAGYRPPLLKMLVATMNAPGGPWALSQAMKIRPIRNSVLCFGGCFDDVRFIDGEFHDLFVKPILESPAVLRGQSGLARQFDWSIIDHLATTTHAKITAPVSMVWGVDDPWFPIERARKMVPQFPGGAELTEVRGKLFTHEEYPEVWARHARTFLQRAFDQRLGSAISRSARI